MLFSGLRSLLLSPSILTTQPCRFAARKGTRIKRQMENRKRARIRAAAAKLEPPKKWVPPSVRVKLDSANIVVGSHFQQESLLKPLPPDNVFFAKGFMPISYDLSEAISMLKETHAPDVLDHPDAIVTACMELDLRTVKRTKFVSPFNGLITDYKHDLMLKQKRTIAAVVPDLKEQEKAAKAGASIIGSADLIKDLLKGRVKVEDFDEIVVHASMLVPLAPLRGILKHHFPSKTKGNYGPDVPELIKKFLSGVAYESERDDFDPAYGTMELAFARLDMSSEEIIENLNVGLAKIEEIHKPTPNPKAEDYAGFIRKVFIKCNSESPERILVKHWMLPSLAELSYVDPETIIVKKKATSEAQGKPKTKKVTLLKVWN